MNDVGIKAAGPDLSRTITFYGKDNKEIGRLDWSSGEMQFTGNADQSAKLFFDNLIAKNVEASKIKLVMPQEEKQINLIQAYNGFKQVVEDAQMQLHPGEPFDMQWILDMAVDSIRRGRLGEAAAILLAIAERTDLLEEPLPGDVGTEPMEPKRDKNGYWDHPGFPWLYMEEGMDVQAILEGMGFVVTFGWAESQLTFEEHDQMIEANDFSNWRPEKPEGKGWYLISIRDTENGAAAIWVRKKASQT